MTDDELSDPALTDSERIGILTRRVSSLERGLTSARLIGAAIGIVMARTARTYDDAYALLAAVSMNTHKPVRELAETVVLTGVVPTDPRT